MQLLNRKVSFTQGLAAIVSTLSCVSRSCLLPVLFLHLLQVSSPAMFDDIPNKSSSGIIYDVQRSKNKKQIAKNRGF